MKTQKTTKRNLFAELVEGVDAMKAQREGKVTLRSHTVAVPEIKVSPEAEWANMLRVSPRTVEKWEQGGQVSPLAATFVELVAHYPDTIERLQTLPRRVSRTSGKARLPGAKQNSASKSRATLYRSDERTGKSDTSLRRSAKVG
jgi:putative transcriptional regulator